MLKRLFDLLSVMVSAPLWLPLLLFVAVLVRLKLGAPIFFRQKRPGLNGEIFDMIKFRTMTNARDSDGALFPDSERLLPFGAWLRSTSLDEIPELLNVLKGDMSLVGPRPLLVQYLQRYNPRQGRRHEVRPGLTGWAQINGRNAISWEEKFEFDVWYVENRSLILDIKILCKTLTVLIKRTGISASDTVTMPEFLGSQKRD